MSKTRTRFVVRFAGHVQGVGFRFTVISQARGLAVDGWVRNEADGSVTLDAEGTVGDLKELVRRIESAMGQNIDSVNIDERELMGRKGGLQIQY